MTKRYKEAQALLQTAVQRGRLLTLTMDIWSKKSLSASFLGISVCFFDPQVNEPHHVLLNLHQISHPHTGNKIAEEVDETLTEWEVLGHKVLMMIIDNGSNMQKAVKELNKTTTADTSDDDDDDDDAAELLLEENESDADKENEDNEDSDNANTVTEVTELDNSLHENAIVHPLACMAHTLQLIVKDGLKDSTVKNLIIQSRSIVRKVRTSSPAIQELTKLPSKTVINDCLTRWKSTLQMLERLLELRPHLDTVFNHNNWDCLVASQWSRVENLIVLLQPFGQYTNLLQSDMSLSNVIPVILDLECHLQKVENYKAIAQTMLHSLQRRFSKLLDPNDNSDSGSSMSGGPDSGMLFTISKASDATSSSKTLSDSTFEIGSVCSFKVVTRVLFNKFRFTNFVFTLQ